jgi:hypothetical protein
VTPAAACDANAVTSDGGSDGGTERSSAQQRGAIMWRIVLSIAGALIVIAGVVWTLQGLGFIRGSVMTGVTLWALIGPLIALCGLAVTVTGLRRTS